MDEFVQISVAAFNNLKEKERAYDKIVQGPTVLSVPYQWGETEYIINADPLSEEKIKRIEESFYQWRREINEKEVRVGMFGLFKKKIKDLVKCGV